MPSVPKLNKRIQDKLLTVAIVILVITALGLGYAVYKVNPQSATEELNISRPQTSGGEEADVLKPPRPDATDEQKRAWAELVAKFATRADALNISNCQPEPVVLRTAEGEELRVKNDDEIDHSIILNPENIITISAKSEMEITADFGKGPGIYAYGCDTSSEAAGVFFVVE